MNKRLYLVGVVIVVLILGSIIYSTIRQKEVPPNESPLENSMDTSIRFLGGLDSYGTPISKYSVDNRDTYYDGTKIAADPETTEVLKGSLEYMKDYITYEYARDNQTVYYAGKPLIGALVEDFQPIENGRGAHYYGTDGRTVYFGSEVIPDADPRTFKILWETIYEGCRYTNYSRDLVHVYAGTTTVLNADPATFESLINGFGKDSRGYYKGTNYIGPTLDQKDLICNYG